MAFKRVAKYGQGFQAAFQSISRISEEIAEIKQCCENIGRDPTELTFSVRMYLDPMGIMEKEKSLTGSTEQIQATVAQFESIGVSHILIDPVAPGGIQGRLTAVESFMESIAD